MANRCKKPDLLIRPLHTGDRAALESIIAGNPLAFLYAAEHLDHFGLPEPSAVRIHRRQYGFMGIFVSRQIGGTIANTGLAVPETAVPASGGEHTRGFPRRLRTAANSFLAPLSHLVRGADQNAAYPEPAMSATNRGTGEQSPQPQFRLEGAFWLGANCVPLVIPDRYRRQAAAVIEKYSRTIASLFGEAHEVLPLWEMLDGKIGRPFSVRENQPLLHLPPDQRLDILTSQKLGRARLEAPPIDPSGVRWARTSDRPSLLQASVAMFTEEVGYNPLSRDPTGYASRVDQLIRTGRSVVATNSEQVVVFKTDIGLAHADTCQIQGVWLHPSYRGMGLSEPLLARAFELIRPRFPHISLYVNDYNRRARKVYESLGMRQRGRFATVLF